MLPVLHLPAPEMLQVLRLPREARGGAQKFHSSPDLRRPLWMKVLQVLRLPRKTRRRPKASLVARLTPTSMKVLQVLRLSRKTNLRCTVCCACHAKRAGDAPSAAPATQNEAAPKSLTRRQTSANLYEGAPSAAPATQNEPEVLRVQVLRLPRKTRRRPKASLVARLTPTSFWRCSKCCACHAKPNWGALRCCACQAAPKSFARRETSANLYNMKVLQVLCLPRKTNLRYSACCACHAKRAGDAPSVAPATQNKAARLPPTSMKVLQVLRLSRKTNLRCSKCCACPKASLVARLVWRCSKCCACHVKRTWGAPSASAPATLNELEMLQVLRLPRKTNSRCSVCCACHAKRAGDAPSVAPATQNKAAPKSLTRRQTYADLYEGAPSAAPVTQNEPEVLRVLRLPRKTSWRCSKCCACHAKRGGAQKLHSSPDFRRPLWRCSKCCACHAKPGADGDMLRMLCWWCCVDGVVLMMSCGWWCVDGVLLMVLCWWCCVDGDVLIVMCWWCCVNGLLLMVLCWWSVVDGDVVDGVVWWCVVDDVVLVALCGWWCVDGDVVDGVVLMVCCWCCCVGGAVWVVMCWWWCVDDCVLMVICWWCCVDGVFLTVMLLMVLWWWWCVDGDVLMVLCWWCVVDGDVLVMLCWWWWGGGRRRRRRPDATRKTKTPHGNVGKNEQNITICLDKRL